MADISEAELQEQKDAIQLFNDANNGKVNIHDLRKLLRSFGEKIDTARSAEVEPPRTWLKVR